MSEIDYRVKYLLDPKPEGEGTGPLWRCDCRQGTRVEAMDTPLNTVRCVNCGQPAVTNPHGSWVFS